MQQPPLYTPTYPPTLPIVRECMLCGTGRLVAQPDGVREAVCDEHSEPVSYECCMILGNALCTEGVSW